MRAGVSTLGAVRLRARLRRTRSIVAGSSPGSAGPTARTACAWAWPWLVAAPPERGRARPSSPPARARRWEEAVGQVPTGARWVRVPEPRRAASPAARQRPPAGMATGTAVGRTAERAAQAALAPARRVERRLATDR